MEKNKVCCIYYGSQRCASNVVMATILSAFAKQQREKENESSFSLSLLTW